VVRRTGWSSMQTSRVNLYHGQAGVLVAFEEAAHVLGDDRYARAVTDGLRKLSALRVVPGCPIESRVVPFSQVNQGVWSRS